MIESEPAVPYFFEEFQPESSLTTITTTTTTLETELTDRKTSLRELNSKLV